MKHPLIAAAVLAMVLTACGKKEEAPATPAPAAAPVEAAPAAVESAPVAAPTEAAPAAPAAPAEK